VAKRIKNYKINYEGDKMTFWDCLKNNKEFGQELNSLIVKFLNKKYYHKSGIKVRNKENGDIYILANYNGSDQYIWVNIKSGCTWGGNFSNDKDPLEIIRNMKYEFLTPKEIME
jgi:hypothetical protein